MPLFISPYTKPTTTHHSLYTTPYTINQPQNSTFYIFIFNMLKILICMVCVTYQPLKIKYDLNPLFLIFQRSENQSEPMVEAIVKNLKDYFYIGLTDGWIPSSLNISKWERKRLWPKMKWPYCSPSVLASWSRATWYNCETIIWPYMGLLFYGGESVYWPYTCLNCRIRFMWNIVKLMELFS